MPVFVKDYDRALESAPVPARRASMLHSTLALANLAALSSASTFLPTAAPLQPALPAGIIFPPATAAAGFGAVCFGLFCVNVAGVVAGAMDDTPAGEA